MLDKNSKSILNLKYFMNIMHIAQCAGGVDRYLSMLLPLLRQQNIHQTFICSQDYNTEEYLDKVDKVIQLDMGQSLNPITIIKVVIKIRRILKIYQPDIVYCHSSMAGGMGRLACLGLPVKIVYNPHGWAFNMQ